LAGRVRRPLDQRRLRPADARSSGAAIVGEPSLLKQPAGRAGNLSSAQYFDSIYLIRTGARRWYVWLLVVLLAASASLGLVSGSKATYEAEGGYVLVPAHIFPATPQQRSPLLYNPLAPNGDASILGEAVQAALTSPDTQQALGGSARGYSPGATPTPDRYVITPPGKKSTGESVPWTPPPLQATYTARTWADTSQTATHVLDEVLARAPLAAAVIQDQAAVPESWRFTTLVTAPVRTTQLPKPIPIMNITLIMVGGVGGGLALSVWLARSRPTPTWRGDHSVWKWRQRPRGERGLDVQAHQPVARPQPHRRARPRTSTS
jgi:hypothetical protein